MAHLFDKGDARVFKSYQAAKNKYDAQHAALMDLVAKKGNAGFYEKAMHKNVSAAPAVHVAAPTGVEAPMYPVRGRMTAPRQIAPRITVPRADGEHHTAPAGVVRGRGRPPVPTLPAAPAAARHTKEEIAVIKHAMRLSGRSQKETNLLYKENREVPTVAAARDIIRAHLAPPKEKKAPKKKTKEAGVGMEREERPTKEAGVDVRSRTEEKGSQTTEKIVSEKEAKKAVRETKAEGEKAVKEVKKQGEKAVKEITKKKAEGEMNAMKMMWAIIRETPGTTQGAALKEAHERIRAME